jgi:Flp pilus assembly protein TadG
VHAPRPRGDGGFSAVELVITMPLLLLLVMMPIQFALWQHAKRVAHVAAQEGARAAREHDGTAEAGQARANAFLDKLGPTIISDRTVAVQRDSTAVTVRVQGRAVSVLPFLGLRVDEGATGPVERFVPRLP